MKFRYQITTQIGVVDTATRQPVIPFENFVLFYDSPVKLNPLNPVDQMLVKRVARVCFENSLLEEDRLKELGLHDTLTEIMHIEHKYVKQVRSKEEEL